MRARREVSLYWAGHASGILTMTISILILTSNSPLIDILYPVTFIGFLSYILTAVLIAYFFRPLFVWLVNLTTKEE